MKQVITKRMYQVLAQILQKQVVKGSEKKRQDVSVFCINLKDPKNK